MKKRDLKLRVKVLEESLKGLEDRYLKLEKDKLTLYNLLYRVNKELDEALANKQTFIASMSHELRSPLTAVLGNSALLHKTGLTRQQSIYLGQLNESADFLMALLSDLLDVSKLKESKVELNVQETQLDKLLLHCANMVESKISKDVDFKVSVPSVSYYVFLDKKRVQQILINILTNAAKFTKSGKIEFSLIEVNQIAEQVEVIIDVEDTGLGISDKIKEKLFQPFTSTDAEEGTGLGLYISHELVTLMGGNIIVNSKEGEGTSFRVIFYCEKSGRKIKKLLENHDKLLIKKEKSYAHLNILIVEDIKVNREFLKEMFKVFFMVIVDVAENGKIAIEKVSKNEYDIIFMDMRMPILNGIEATQKIRTFNKKVPIICMSANVYREDKHEAKMAGMNDFIEKPLEPKDIEERLIQVDAVTSKSMRKEEDNQLRKIALNHFKEHFNEDTAIGFIEMAEEGLIKNITALKKNVSLENRQGLIDNFHAIQGILSNLGLEELAKKAGFLQKFVKDEAFKNINKRLERFLLKVEVFFN